MRQYIAIVEDKELIGVFSIQADRPAKARQLVQEYYQQNWHAEIEIASIKVKAVRSIKKPVQFIGSVYVEESK